MARYIEAEKIISTLVTLSDCADKSEEYTKGIDDAILHIRHQHHADVRENVRGKWLFDDGSVATGELQDKNVHCSICGHSAPGKPWWECHLELTNYCPCCGAKMDS